LQPGSKMHKFSIFSILKDLGLRLTGPRFLMKGLITQLSEFESDLFCMSLKFYLYIIGSKIPKPSTFNISINFLLLTID
jgi:hypothetical protein